MNWLVNTFRNIQNSKAAFIVLAITAFAALIVQVTDLGSTFYGWWHSNSDKRFLNHSIATSVEAFDEMLGPANFSAVANKDIQIKIYEGNDLFFYYAVENSSVTHIGLIGKHREGNKVTSLRNVELGSFSPVCRENENGHCFDVTDIQLPIQYCEIITTSTEDNSLKSYDATSEEEKRLVSDVFEGNLQNYIFTTYGDPLDNRVHSMCGYGGFSDFDIHTFEVHRPDDVCTFRDDADECSQKLGGVESIELIGVHSSKDEPGKNRVEESLLIQDATLETLGLISVP